MGVFHIMKTIKILLSFALIATLFTSCYTEVVVDDFNDFIEEPSISLNQLLRSHELWYVDINNTLGYGETPFLQKAFTVSFINGVVYANNNISGLGTNGAGFGIDVGEYDAYDIDMSSAKERFKEAIKIINQALLGEPFEFKGDFYEVGRKVAIRRSFLPPE